MLIVGDKIVDDELILKSDKEHIKNASYYLTIGSIIPAGEAAREFDPEKPTKTLVLEPRQIAWVVSNEVFNIKDHGVTALVTLRSTMTKRGLLALDVGLVDPDYEGPIGSVVINFSKDRVTLNQGEEFFRVIFFSHDEIPQQFREKRPKYDAIKYIKERHSEIVKDFPESFLGSQEITKEIHDIIFDKLLLYIIKTHWGKVIAGTCLATILIVAISIGSYYLIAEHVTQEDIVNIIKNNKEIIELFK